MIDVDPTDAARAAIDEAIRLTTGERDEAMRAYDERMARLTAAREALGPSGNGTSNHTVDLATALPLDQARLAELVAGTGFAPPAVPSAPPVQASDTVVDVNSLTYKELARVVVNATPDPIKAEGIIERLRGMGWRSAGATDEMVLGTMRATLSQLFRDGEFDRPERGLYQRKANL